MNERSEREKNNETILSTVHTQQSSQQSNKPSYSLTKKERDTHKKITKTKRV